MTPDWDVLRDRPCPPVVPSAHRTCTASALLAWTSTDAELLAVFACVVARYTGSGDVAVGWSDGDRWRRIALVVDFDRPVADVVAQAAHALTSSDPGPVPAFGISGRLTATAGGPSLLAMGADGTLRYAEGCYTEAEVHPLRPAPHDLRTGGPAMALPSVGCLSCRSASSRTFTPPMVQQFRVDRDGPVDAAGPD